MLRNCNEVANNKLLAQTNQTSVFQMSFRAVATAAWKQLAPCNNMKTFVKDRLKTWSGRCSRFNQCGKWPSQGVRGSLFTSMVSVWNYLPEDIKTSKTLLLAKRKIRNFVAENIIWPWNIVEVEAVCSREEMSDNWRSRRTLSCSYGAFDEFLLQI